MAVNNNRFARSTDVWSTVGKVVGVLAVSMLLIIVCVIVGGIWYQRSRKERYTSVELHPTSDESSMREQQRHEPSEDDQSSFAKGITKLKCCCHILVYRT